MKINIIGCTGAGKTTLGKSIGSRLSIPCVDLDEIAYGPNWTCKSKVAVEAELLKILVGDSWVICGNYKAYRDMIMGEADYILWLDYSFWTNLSRLMKRTFRRVIFREPCCNGNYETLFQVCCTKNSIIYFFFKTFWKVKKNCAELIQDVNLGGKVIRLRDDQETEGFVCLIASQNNTPT